MELFSPADAVQRALALAERSDKPVVIADTQDNPGAGADSNTTGMLHALLAAGAGNRFPGQVALGLMFDPAAAKTRTRPASAHRWTWRSARRCACFDGSLSDPPLRARFKVLSPERRRRADVRADDGR